MNKLDEILNDNPELEFLKADGFDDAVIGVNKGILIYSSKKCIEILKKDMLEKDAIEFFEFNVSGSYVGEKTPKFKKDY